MNNLKEPEVEISIPLWGKEEKFSVSKAQELIEGFIETLKGMEKIFAEEIKKNFLENPLYCKKCGQQLVLKSPSDEIRGRAGRFWDIICPEVEINPDWEYDNEDHFHVCETALHAGGPHGVYARLAELREKGEVY